MRLETLSPETFRRLDALLDVLIDVEAVQRSAEARRLCADDPALLEPLLRMVEGLDASHVLDEPVAVDMAAAIDEEGLEGQRAGPYELLELLGAGGMGSVYRARRADGAYEREVAVKVVRRGMDSARLLDRFHRERAILARLEHPGITRIIDAGILEDGRPYVTMDLVEGRPWNEGCAERPLRDRVELVELVCRAVSYAHERLVVHRDIKPSNVLITPDGEAVLLDFGVAKLVDDDEQTRVAERMLTPKWAAPEQLDGGAVDVRTDVYALGLMLHSTLTLRSHVDRDEQGWCQAPSASALDPERDRVTGDLDAIALAALRPDPDARYPSVRALADDLGRYLRAEPVEARPERWYRAKMWTRRHAAALAAALVLVGLLAAYAVTVTRQAAVVAQQRDRARAQAVRNRALSDFLRSLLASDHARAVEGESLTVGELLDRGRGRLERTPLPPDVRGELSLITAEAYYDVSRWDDAVELLSAVASSPEYSAQRRSEALVLLSYALRGSQRREIAVEPALKGVKLAIAAHGLLDPGYAPALDALAGVLASRDHEWAPPLLYGWSLLLRVLSLGPVDPALVDPIVGLADTLGRPRLFEWALFNARLASPPDETQIADTLHKYARHVQSDPIRARTLFEQALAIERRVYGAHHPFTLNTLNDLGLQLETRDPDAAIALLEEAAHSLADRLPPGHPRRLVAQINLGAVARDQGRLDMASTWLERAVDQAELSGSALVVDAAYHLGRLREREGNTAEAADAYRRGLARCALADRSDRERWAAAWLRAEPGPATKTALGLCFGPGRLEAFKNANDLE